MAYSYVVTSQPASTVLQSCTGHFTSVDQLNLIIAKPSAIEITLVTPNGLQNVLQFNIYGSVSVLQLIRVQVLGGVQWYNSLNTSFQGEPLDWMFVSTDAFSFFILYYDQQTGEIVTKATGSVMVAHNENCLQVFILFTLVPHWPQG